MLRTGLPPYRLPKDVVDRDIKNVTALGVEIRTGAKVESLSKLRADGFDAVFVSVGAPIPKKLRVEGEDHPGVMSGIALLLADVADRREGAISRASVSSSWGAAVCRDRRRADGPAAPCARGAPRCASKSDQMPAAAEEIHEALEEGIALHNGLGREAHRRRGREPYRGSTKAVHVGFDERGAFAPRFAPASAQGMSPTSSSSPSGRRPDRGLRRRRGQLIEYDDRAERTLDANVPELRRRRGGHGHR